MTPERFEECKQVEQKINRIEEEINIWKELIISPCRLGYFRPRNNCDCDFASLKSNIEDSEFQKMKEGVISHLNSLLESEKVKFKAM